MLNTVKHPAGVAEGALIGAKSDAAIPNPQSLTLYVDDDYCSGCANDGHIWHADAFASIHRRSTRFFADCRELAS